MKLSRLCRLFGIVMLALLLGLAASPAFSADKAKPAAKAEPAKPGPSAKIGPSPMAAPSPMGGEEAGTNEDPYNEEVADANLEGLESTADTLDKETIGSYVAKKQKAVRDCYEKELQTNQKLKGLLAISFTIQVNGSVSEATVNKEKTTLKDAKVVECVLKVIKSAKFPERKTGEPQVINYPFRFQPVNEKQ